jgi:putative ABC transport system permease protein
MITNFYKIAIRNIVKHKVYSLINVFGLAVGFTAFILISLYINYEFNWDTHNKNYDRIYRVQTRLLLADRENVWTQVPSAVAGYLETNYPEFEKIVLTREGWGEFLSAKENISFREEDGYYVDPSVFDIFTFDFITGNKNDALKEPFTIALSQELAQKFFPGENAVGKTVLLEKKYNLKVTAIFKDFPRSSHFRPTYLIPFNSFPVVHHWPDARNNWGSYAFRVYGLLKKGADAAIVEQKLANIINEYRKDPVKQKLFLHPLSKIYLMPEDNTDYMNAMFMYGLIAVFILLLTSINYVNLTIANSAIRAKEIAVRKVCGSSKAQLIFQYLSESSLIALIAVNFAFFFAELSLPFFNQAIGTSLEISYAGNWPFILKMIMWAVIIGLLSGIYPAMVMSSYKSVDLFRSNIFTGRKSKVGLKKVLVSFQFGISIYLIISSIAMNRQVEFMMNKDLGFNKENMLFCSIRSEEKRSFEALRNKVLQHPEIADMTISSNIPFNGSDGRIINWEGAQADGKVDIRINWVSYDFVKTLGIEIIQGRDFSREYPGDFRKRCLINETAWKQFGWDNPLGKKINDGKCEIVGVMKDYHLNSVHNRIQPCMIELKDDTTAGSWDYTFRIAPGKLSEAKNILKTELESFFPSDAFELKVYSEYLKDNDNLKAYNSISNTFTFFSFLNIILAIIGLLGLVSFSTKRRTKEIGIRKVHGGRVFDIFIILIKDYIMLVLYASVFACPAAYYVFTSGMPAAYKAGMQPWEFIAGTLIILVITILVTSFHTIKAAITNPVEALRYE